MNVHREMSLKARKLGAWGHVTLHTQGLITLAQVQSFVSSNEAISVTLTDRVVAYGWMVDTLKQFHYARCIRQFTDDGAIHDLRRPPAVPFVRHYTTEDIRLLAEMDALHDTVSGPTTRKLCERAFQLHGGCSL